MIKIPEMNARRRFLNIFKKMPGKARFNLIFEPFDGNPMSMNIIGIEIKCKTKLGFKLLEKMGFL